MFTETAIQKNNLKLQDYKIYKQQILDIFQNYKNLRGEINDGIDLKSLERRIENLKNNQFLVAVAGEVKAGKSTFINSLIKEEILPTDVLQATNALIEIFYSSKPYLKVTYASGKIEILEDEAREVLKEKLKEIASISEEYRDIPVTLIDLYILENKKSPFIDDEFIKYLEDKSGMENLKELKYKLENYAMNRSLDNIPVRIELGYPFPWEFDEIRLVDMPGVNAVGGVHDISFSFLDKANAILFVHPIKPVESESFKKFISSVITNKSKENLFLILTHSAVFFEEKERLLEEAKRIYSSLVSPDRIFAVDSILKSIHEDLQKGKTLAEIKKEYRHKRKWVVYFQDLAEEEGLDEKEAFIKYSGFHELIPVLENFLISAPFKELIDILKTIKAGYEEQVNIHKETIRLLQSQKKDREEFIIEIEKKQKGLKKLETYCYFVLEEASSIFIGVHSPIENSLDQLKIDYYDRFLNSKDLEEIRKHYRDAENDLNRIVQENLKNISKFFREKLEQIGEQYREEYNIQIPKIDFSAIEERCRKEVIRKEEITKEVVESIIENWNFLKPWKWLKSGRTKRIVVGEREVLNEEAYLKSLKNNLIESFVEVIETLRDQFYKAFEFYKKGIGKLLEEKRNYLENLKKELKSNEKIDYEILMLEKNIALIEKEVKIIEGFLKGLS
ncbi:MAG: dynamin family protein [Thermodesulfobacterium sp.]|nr:dynamin family protein [Thermodesulfobacterium sp.]